MARGHRATDVVAGAILVATALTEEQGEVKEEVKEGRKREPYPKG